MAERICFLGRGGSGKSAVAQNLSHALAQKGYHVLLIGNDISLSSTLLLRGEMDIYPALEEYREKYEIDLHDYILATPSGVYCLELGSIDPGIGCMARGINLIDEMLDTQGVSNDLQLDYILYDISGETPCTGYILPIREGLMQRCLIVTNGSFAAVTTANTILQAVVTASGEENFPVQLIVNCAECREELATYARRATIEILAFLNYDEEVEYSSLAGKTVFSTNPTSIAATHFSQIADDLLCGAIPTALTPFPRRDLIVWLRDWQHRELSRRLALAEEKRNGV
ncbi:MAG: P-loop NTPase [Ruthenibacterium sp.]